MTRRTISAPPAAAARLPGRVVPARQGDHRRNDDQHHPGRPARQLLCLPHLLQAVEVSNRYKVDRAYGGPEYETVGSLGSVCGIGDLEAIAYANQLCNAYGLDTISAGMTIAWAMECFERGLIGPEDTGGLEVRFGNADVMLELLEQIAHRRGFGKLLADGSLRAARPSVATRSATPCRSRARAAHARAAISSRSTWACDFTHGRRPLPQHPRHGLRNAGGHQGHGALLGRVDPLPADYLGPEKVRLASTPSTGRCCTTASACACSCPTARNRCRTSFRASPAGPCRSSTC